MAHDVFVSYSARDKAVANALCATLEARKIRCWIAPRDVPPGATWARALVEAIGESRVFVLVFSDGSNQSTQVIREVGEAVEKGIPVIPFRIEDVQPSKELGYYIKAVHWLDALTPPLEEHLQRLANTVQMLLGASPGEERPVPTPATVEREVAVVKEARLEEQPSAPAPGPARAIAPSPKRGKTGPPMIVGGVLGILLLVLVVGGVVWSQLSEPMPTVAPAATPTTMPPASKAGVGMKAGLVTDVGGVDDRSFNASAWDGVERAIEEFGMEGRYLQSQAETDYERNINEFLQADYDIIVTVGWMLNSATKAAAEANPDVPFAIVDQEYVPPVANILGSYFATDEASFLAGYVSAAMTKTGAVGTYGGVPNPSVTIFMVGFEQGVKYYNQVHGTNVRVIGWDSANPDAGLFTFDFESTDNGRRFTESLMQEGADIILPVAGPVGMGTAAVCKERGCMMIGVDKDWYISAPEYKEVFLTSLLKGVDLFVYESIKAVVEGTFEGGTAVYNLSNNGVDLSSFHDYDDDVPQSVKDELVTVRQGLIDGTIKTGWPLPSE